MMPDHRWKSRQSGFTLLELLVSTGLALIMAGIATDAFYRIRLSVARSQARIALFTNAQRIYTLLNREFSGLQQTGAFIAESVQNGTVRIIYLGSHEHGSDFGRSSNPVGVDLGWKELNWERSATTLWFSENQPSRTFVSGSFTPGTVNYNGRTFQNVPQPRRYLDPTNPINASVDSLNDNVLFPNASLPAISLANANDDIGDYTDLDRNREPISQQVSDVSWDIVAMDGTSFLLDDSSTTVTPHVLQGVWADARMATTLDASANYLASPQPKRPRLIRLRLTMRDAKVGVESVFSFSFALPGLSGAP